MNTNLYFMSFLLVTMNVFLINSSGSSKTLELFSPNEKIKIIVDIGAEISYSVLYENEEIICPSNISMTINDGLLLGRNAELKHIERKTIDEIIHPVVPEKRKSINNKFNELKLFFNSDFGLNFRAYDDGIAYQFFTQLKSKIRIVNEEANFNFPKERNCYFPYEDSFLTHSERLYPYVNIKDISTDAMACLPVLFDEENNIPIAITEANLLDYPGMYLTKSGDRDNGLRAIFPAYPSEEKQLNDRTIEVSSRTNYIAETTGERTFPWRVIMIAKESKDMVDNDIVFRLADPLKIEDTSWIRPGKVAWDWWNALNLYGVDFKSGVNTETYKYFIDFAAKHKIEYIILDEGWSDTEYLLKINPDVNLEQILEYAKQKDVGVILWCIWIALEKQFHEVFDQFDKWGIRGIKVDFMQRDDQKLVNYYSKIVAEAAKYQLLVDFHGAYKPTGLRRAYPNLITREGVRGLEHSKWSKDITPDHDLILPFTRQLAGPMDFTPGAMINAQKEQFSPVFSRPMSQGTRVHQLAMYIIYESPLQMLCDSPSNYEREPEMMEFLSNVPTTWDETHALNGKVGDFLTVARKKNTDWYIGSMTDWTPREFQIKLDFLDSSEYSMTIYADGINADRCGIDYQKSIQKIRAGDTVNFKMASGGGWVARLIKTEN